MTKTHDPSEFDLHQLGFQGFVSIGVLKRSLSVVPREAGVYAVARPPDFRPEFGSKSCGGRFKGRDPTVSIQELREKWIKDALTIYIGKAGGGKSEATLRSRIKQYLDFGRGRPVGHWGGRYIWQLARRNRLIVAWKTTPQESASILEHDLLKAFALAHGGLPFANLPPGRRRISRSDFQARDTPATPRAKGKQRHKATAEFHRRRFQFAQAMQFMGGAVKSCLDDPHDFILAILPEYVLKLFRCGVWQQAGDHLPNSIVEDLSQWLDGMSQPELMKLLEECGWQLQTDWWHISEDVRARFVSDHQHRFVLAWEDGAGIDPENDPLMDEP